jgi:hypothetical protein
MTGRPVSIGGRFTLSPKIGDARPGSPAEVTLALHDDALHAFDRGRL